MYVYEHVHVHVDLEVQSKHLVFVGFHNAVIAGWFLVVIAGNTLGEEIHDF